MKIRAILTFAALVAILAPASAAPKKAKKKKVKAKKPAVNKLDPRAILLPKRPTLSPDGRTLVFSYQGDLWSTRSSGGTARRITFHPAFDSFPRFSPDGKQLAFVSDRSGSFQVYVMPAQGGPPKQITFHTEGHQLEGWFPDGKSVLTSGRRAHHWRSPTRFFRIDLTARKNEQLLFDAHGSHGSLSPDGSKLLFVREGERWWRKGYRGSRAAQIWMFDLKRKKFSKVLHEATECRYPMWNPDGSGFFFVSNREGAFNLYSYDWSTKKTARLTDFDDDSVLFPAIARDGTDGGPVIVFRHLFDLYRLRVGKDKKAKRLRLLNTGDPTRDRTMRRTLKRATNVSYTKDGLEIAFIAGGDLWVMDSELREPVQVATSAHEINEPVFSKDAKALYFISDKDDQFDVWKAEKQSPARFWWHPQKFKLSKVTNDKKVEYDLSISPNGQYLAFVRKPGDLWLKSTKDGKERRILTGFSLSSYTFSPDSKWIAYAGSDNDFNREIWIVPIDGSRKPYNVSRNPDNDGSIAWSPDGRLLAYTGQRKDQETDIYYVWLREEDNDATSRQAKLQKAITKMKLRGGTTSALAEALRKRFGSTKTSGVKIDFDDLYKRVKRVRLPDVSESGLFFDGSSPTKLYFAATISGKRGTYAIEFPTKLKPTFVHASTGSLPHWIARFRGFAWLSNGVPGLFSPSKAMAAPMPFSIQQELNRGERYQAAFEQAWRVMRDYWYDERLNNRDWQAVKNKYKTAAAACYDENDLSTIVHLMLGELNGSHLGFYPTREATRVKQGWNVTTAHLGIVWDRRYRGPGLRVGEIITGGPADKSGTGVKEGDVVIEINGVEVSPTFDLTRVLNGSLARDIRLAIQVTENWNDAPRIAVIRPTTYSAIRTLMYRRMARKNHEMVQKLSKGKLGYLHIQSMGKSNFEKFQKELYEIGYGKDGLVIDVRDNGGGYIADHLLTALSQPRHAFTVPRGGGRGYPQDRTIYASWHKPIIVLCNQNSFSNAEIFSHAVKTLNRGQVVGVPTAGGVISTGAVTIMDVGRLRLPFRGWFLKNDGADMELNGAVPHHIVWPLPGELPAGKDRQLERAVSVLSADVKKWKSRPVVRPRYASEDRLENGTKTAGDMRE